jgi:hypothetical protein
MAYTPPSFVDACAHFVRKLVQAAYSMPANSVRPAGQAYPTGKELDEFATVKIDKGPSGDWGTWWMGWSDDPTTNSTKVVETLESLYRFTASVQFFRHASPSKDGAGLASYGLGAVDRAARLEAVLASSDMMELMERMGLGLEGGGDPVDVGALVNGATWEDRGMVTLDFAIVNREQFLIESIGSAEAILKYASPGATEPTTTTIEVAS